MMLMMTDNVDNDDDFDDNDTLACTREKQVKRFNIFDMSMRTTMIITKILAMLMIVI